MPRLYLHLIQEMDGYAEFPSAIQRLQECILSAPGIEVVEKVEKHPKGGYSVIATRSEAEIEPILEHLRSLGYRAVI